RQRRGDDRHRHADPVWRGARAAAGAAGTADGDDADGERRAHPRLRKRAAHGTLETMRWVLLAVGLLAGCGSGDPAAAVVKNYAVNLQQNYKDVLPKLDALQAAVDAFVANPTAAGLESTRAAWLAARAPYSECEYSRFYGGPID